MRMKMNIIHEYIKSIKRNIEHDGVESPNTVYQLATRSIMWQIAIKEEISGYPSHITEHGS